MWPLVTAEAQLSGRPNTQWGTGAVAPNAVVIPEEGDSHPRGGETVVAMCLGGFSLYLRGEVVSPARWATRKGGRGLVAGVMAYLVAHRHQRITRERLVDIFWDQVDGDRASQSLDRTISALRRALEPGLRRYGQSAYILGPRGGYRFSSEVDLAIDAEEFVARFKQAAEAERREDLDTAARLYQQADAVYAGPFMDGVPYAELWCHHQRQLLADYHRTALTRLTRLAWLSRDFDRVTGYAHRVLDEYGCQAEVCRRLTDAYIEDGTTAMALRHVECCPLRRLAGGPCIELAGVSRR